MEGEQETYYIIGESRTNGDNAITKLFGSFFIALEVDSRDGLITEMNCTHSLDLTEQFLRKLFVGRSLETQAGLIEEDVLRRYYGSSAKAVLAALKDAEKRYWLAKKRPNA